MLLLTFLNCVQTAINYKNLEIPRLVCEMFIFRLNHWKSSTFSPHRFKFVSASVLWVLCCRRDPAGGPGLLSFCHLWCGWKLCTCVCVCVYRKLRSDWCWNVQQQPAKAPCVLTQLLIYISAALTLGRKMYSWVWCYPTTHTHTHADSFQRSSSTGFQ